MNIKRKHTKSHQAILERINHLENVREAAANEISELLAIIDSHRLNVEVTIRAFEREGIKPAY